jgi:hypothetical protein
LLSLVVLWSSTPTEAAIGFRQLTSVHPVAVQRGTKATVALRSNFTLDGTYATFFDRPGIKMTYAEAKPIAAPLTGRGRPGTPFHFEVEVPADQAPDVYEFRVATPEAVSSVSHLLVTDYPVIVEQTKDNNTRAAAQSVPVPSAVCGVCEKAEDVDHYRFSGKAGQELTCQIFAQRVTAAIHDMVGGGHYHMDPILTLYSPHDQVVAQQDNMYGGDSLLHCRLPEAGEYVLEVRDTRYAGDLRYSYCVEISDGPAVETVFPLAVQRGKSVEAEPIGFALAGLKHVTLAAAADEPLGWTKRRFSNSHGLTNPVAVFVSQHPQIIAEQEHTSRETALTLTLPVGVNGRFEQPNVTHYYAFEAKKGSYYRFEVEAQRGALPVDPVLEIQDAKGKRVVEVDDTMPTQDPQYLFQAPADGKYYVSLRDLHGRAGPDFLYLLRAEPSGPDFEVQGEYYYGLLSPGTSTIWFVRVNRLNGFDGPVEIAVEGLPKGVTFTPVTVPGKVPQVGLILSAAKDAKVGAALVHVTGKAAIPDAGGKPREVTRVGQVTCELQSQGGGQGRWPIHTQIVGVSKALDLRSVVATPSEVKLAPGGKAELKVRIERSESYTDPVQLSMSFIYFTNSFGEQLPPGVKMSSASTTRLTGKALEGKIVLEATPKATPVERLPIAVIAGVSISFSINTFYASNPVYLTVPEAKPAKK